jgi:proteasome lid subunit RPN8/RPN11
LTWLGVFHSHPDHPSQPSETDLKLAAPWLSYLITRVEKGKAMETRSWRLNDDYLQFSEEKIEIKD